MAASLLKKGKQFAREMNAILAAPENSQAASTPQQPYGSYAPSAGLSPYFQQQQGASHYQGPYNGSVQLQGPYNGSTQYQAPYADPAQYQTQLPYQSQRASTPQPGFVNPQFPAPPNAIATTNAPHTVWQPSAEVAPAPTPVPNAASHLALGPPASSTQIISPSSPAPQAWPSATPSIPSHPAPQNHQSSQSQWLASPSTQNSISRSSSPYPQMQSPPQPTPPQPNFPQSAPAQPYSQPAQPQVSSPQSAQPQINSPQPAPPQPYSPPQSAPPQVNSSQPTPLPYLPSQSAPPQALQSQYEQPLQPQHTQSFPVATQNGSPAPLTTSATHQQTPSVGYTNVHNPSYSLSTHHDSNVHPQPFDMSSISAAISSINQATVSNTPSNPPHHFPPAHIHQTSAQYTLTQPAPVTNHPTMNTLAHPAASQYSLVPYGQDSQLQLAAPQPQILQAIQPMNLSSSSREIAQPAPPVQRPSVQQRAQTTASVLRVQKEGHAATARKILCLDGGGVRGLASLMIVKHLIDRLEIQRGGRLEPWQEFDMIAGTSTGGLIAIMLGRLRMPVDECIEVYQRMSRKIFTPVHSKANLGARAVAKFKAEGKFESEPLEESVKQICRDNNLSESELLKDNDEDAPKVFVCAVQGSNSDSVVIRSYRSPTGEWDELYPICKIWEAARATSAASTFFDPIKIGHQRYVDGALRYNNPVDKADEESKDLWPNQDRIIISIGTGCAPGPKLLGNAVKLIETLAKIVTDSEEENARFRKRNREMIDNNRLYRFNVLHGLADVKLDEWDALEDISAHTSTYLRSPDTAREFQKCATILKEVGQRLGYIAGEELQVHQKIQELSNVYTLFCEDCHKGISYNEKMFYCVDCQMYACSRCNQAHDRDHIRRMLRFELMQWMPKLPKVAETTSCRYCAKDTNCRWECTSCGWALCLTCVAEYDRRKEFFTDHCTSDPDGRFFVAVYPPYWRTSPQWVTDPCPCLDLSDSTCQHCDACHKVFTYTDRAYWCHTCNIEFGDVQALCQQCYEQADEEHKGKHQFGTIDFAFENTVYETVGEAEKMVWGCIQCPERFPDAKRHFHSHPYHRLFISPLIAELMKQHTFQLCRRKEARAALKAPSDPAPYMCNICFTALAFEQAGSICLQPGCDNQFCGSCTQSPRKSWHRHYLYDIVIKRPPPNFMGQLACSYCATAYIIGMAQGLWCADCNRHFMCLVCVYKVVQAGGPIMQEGLPHQKILKPCKVKNGWILYLTS